MDSHQPQHQQKDQHKQGNFLNKKDKKIMVCIQKEGVLALVGCVRRASGRVGGVGGWKSRRVEEWASRRVDGWRVAGVGWRVLNET